jgi:transposase-like protein
MNNSFRDFKASPEIIRFPLSLRNVKDLLHEPGIGARHETVRDLMGRAGS